MVTRTTRCYTTFNILYPDFLTISSPPTNIITIQSNTDAVRTTLSCEPPSGYSHEEIAVEWYKGIVNCILPVLCIYTAFHSRRNICNCLLMLICPICSAIFFCFRWSVSRPCERFESVEGPVSEDRFPPRSHRQEELSR